VPKVHCAKAHTHCLSGLKATAPPGGQSGQFSEEVTSQFDLVWFVWWRPALETDTRVWMWKTTTWRLSIPV